MSDLHQSTASRTDPGHVIVSAGRRGSHATLRGQGFSWVISWTIAGSLLPGCGLLAAGWRRAGGLLLTLTAAGTVALGWLALGDDPLHRIGDLLAQPQRLTAITVSIGLIAAVWVTSILLTHTQLRRYATLSTGQRQFSTILVLALVTAVALPAYQAGRYALISQDLVRSVFQDSVDNQTSQVLSLTGEADPWAARPRVNVLLIGSDAGADRIGVRPDTLIVASIDTTSGNTVLFSLPRNLERVPFPPGTPGAAAWPNGYDCGDECLLNAVWTWAEGPDSGYAGYRHPGLAATEDAVTGATGLQIDTYAMLNLQGFAEVVNAIGGLTVNVRQRLPIGGDSDITSPLYHQAPGGWIEVGEGQRLDGYHTLWFARSRWSTDDYSRMQRQRCVIAAFVDQVDPVIMALRFPLLARAAKHNISTGIPLSDLDAWVTLSKRVKDGKVTSLPFTREVVDVAEPDFDRVHQLVQRAIRRSEAGPTPQDRPGPTPPRSTTTKPSPPTATPTPTRPADRAQDVTEVC